MKKVISIVLAFVMLCSLTACDLGGASMEQLCGQWQMTVYQDGDTAEILQKRVMEQAEWILLPKAAEMVSAKLCKE